MSVKFKPIQIAMPLSANYGRWYAKMVPTATVTSAPHDNTRQHERVFCYIVTLLHCYIKVVSQCSHAKPRAPLRLPWAMELLGLQPAAHAL